MNAVQIWTPDTWPTALFPNFSFAELACQETGSNMMDPTFMKKLQHLRNACGFGLKITSGFRHPEHSIEAAKEQLGAHTFGMAVDIGVYGDRAHAVIGEAYALGFMGIGVKQEGSPWGRFIHLDTLTPEVAERFPRPTIWSY